jgi:carbamoyltransferase
MKIIGINYLSESSVCLLDRGKIISSVSEERINRKKNWYGLPEKSIKYILTKNKIKLKDIDYFVTSGISAIDKSVPDKKIYSSKIKEIQVSNLNLNKKDKQIAFLKQRFKHEKKVIHVRTKNLLNKLKSKYKKLIIYDHHLSHAASAYFNSGFKDCFVVTIDGWGDNSSSKIFYFKDGNYNEISSTPTIDSLGYFYGSITKLLGFKPHQHEGKILGLAAYGNQKKIINEISEMIKYDSNKKVFKGCYENGFYQSTFDNKNLRVLLKKYSVKDIAASTQLILEKTITKCIKELSKDKINLALAGGVFANVKLNQKIRELKNIKNMYIFPNMGDGGLSVGGAQLLYHKKTKNKPKKIKDMYLGHNFSDKEILKEIKKYQLNFLKFNKIEEKIAELLSQKKVIAHFNDKMEFGPRALGNRSILCSASDKNINNWLNKRLKRTEFMPFAPIILKSKIKDYMYVNNARDYLFMTMTCKCKKIMSKKAPAAVHVDDTARPQIIDKYINPRINLILENYYKITGVPILINTSFNMHEEPIVCTPGDAIRGFIDGQLDYLVINNYLIKKY